MPEGNEDSSTTPPQLPESSPEGLVWSAGKTMLWSALIFAIYVATQMFAALVVGAFYAVTGRMDELDPEKLESNGLVLGLLTWFSLPFLVGGCIGFARMKRGLPVQEYLAIVWVPFRKWWPWIPALFAFVAVSDFIVHSTGRPIIPQFMHDVHETAGFLPLLWATLLIAAPVGEEVFFRGFMFRGLEYSRLGWLGATVVTSAIWAFIHFQYDWIGITVIFALGLLFGAIRHRTGSIIPCVLLHTLMNLIATVELLIIR